MFTFGNEYANYGPIAAGNEIEVTVQGATDTTTATFAAEGAPSVTGVSPSSGPISGGTTVTLTGTNFSGATQVVFGTVAGTGLTVVNATTITVVSPAEAAGAHNIQVTTPSGTSAKVAADEFTFEGAPSVTGVSPSSGPVSGGTTVTLTGTNFSGATQVVFGTVAGTGLTVVNATTITVVSPAEAAGAHNIQVTTPSGTSAKVAADEFTFEGAPSVTGVSPSWVPSRVAPRSPSPGPTSAAPPRWCSARWRAPVSRW